jgi:hypothetical protein
LPPRLSKASRDRIMHRGEKPPNDQPLSAVTFSPFETGHGTGKLVPDERCFAGLFFRLEDVL